MITGDEYLEAHEQLDSTLVSLSMLAQSLNAGQEKLQALQSLRQSLHDPGPVIRGGDHLSRLRTVFQHAQIHLRDIGVRVRTTLSLINKDIKKLHELHLSIKGRREESMRQASGIVWSLAQSSEHLQKLGEDMLEEQLSLSRTCGSKKGSWKEIVRLAIDGTLNDCIHGQIQSSFDQLEADLQCVFIQVHESLRKRISTEVNSAIIPELVEERRELIAHVEFSIIQVSAPEGFSRQMRELFTSTARWLRVTNPENLNPVIDALTKLILADFSTALTGEKNAPPGIALAFLKRKKILASFRSEMAQKRELLATTVENQLVEGISALYEKLITILIPLQKFYATQKRLFEPRLAAVMQMEESLANASEWIGARPAH